MLNWIWSETMSLPNLCPISFSERLGCHAQDSLSEGDPTACYARGGMKVVQTEQQASESPEYSFRR